VSIATKTGDLGTTALMFNRRVSKCHPRIEACGAVDELNSTIGMARAIVQDEFVKKALFAAQKDLFALMGELATAIEDSERYAKAGYPSIGAAHTARLDQLVTDLEAQQGSFNGWAVPGESAPSAALDMARTTCRRAERNICGLLEAGELPNLEIIAFLNRLSDALWLLARRAE
jgi:cob(I)alamin adenosyltransferase